MDIETTLAATAARYAAELEAILQEERRLHERRTLVQESLLGMLAALAEMRDARPPAAPTPEARRGRKPGPNPRPKVARLDPPAFVPPLSPEDRSSGSGKLLVGARRRYMQAAVSACRGILLEMGRPMTVREILALHPQRARLPERTLYKALEQRSGYADPAFRTKNGMFWVADRPLPQGWVHPKGTLWAFEPKMIVNAGRKGLKRAA